MPNLTVIAGPNGAGKSTVAPALLRDTLGINEFVNADVIARGLSGFASEAAAVAAGRAMLSRLDELAHSGVDFAFESTLRSRGYRFHLMFLWLPSAALAIERVRHRAATGGHSVPEDTIRRRYDRGLRNFFDLYRRPADRWDVHDNSQPEGPRLIARYEAPSAEEILDAATWKRIQADASTA